MKTYFFVFSMLWSFICFGQHGCSLKFCYPENSFSFVYEFHNHFQDFFPSNKMKALNVKSISIFSEIQASVPSIHINESPNSIFIFDKNGFVNYYKNNEEEVFYTRENGKILTKSLFSFLYREDTVNSYYFYDSTRMIINYDPIENFAFESNEYIYDDKKRIKSHIYHDLDSFIDTTNYNYDDVNKKLTVTHEEKEGVVKVVTNFNNQWQPIKEQITLKEIIGFEANYSYKNNFLISYDFFILRPKMIQNESGEWIELNSKDINTYVKIKHQSTFYYNSKGLLEKIIQATEDGVCEYRVYYNME